MTSAPIQVKFYYNTQLYLSKFCSLGYIVIALIGENVMWCYRKRFWNWALGNFAFL